MTQHNEFFRRPKVHSKVKTRIVVTYFSIWTRIVGRTADKLTYLDLFSGEGSYEDGTPSTPIQMIQSIKKFEPGLRKKIRLHFYEENKQSATFLREKLFAEFDDALLEHKPTVNCVKITPDIVSALPVNNTTFTFIDPFGYKDFTPEIPNAVIKEWGSDCLFYFNIAGIRRNIQLESQFEHFEQLFGRDGLSELQNLCLDSTKSEEFYGTVCRVLKRMFERSSFKQPVYFLPFAVEADDSSLISYALVFISGHEKGFKIMKEVMAKLGPSDSDGIPLYRSKTNKSFDLFNSRRDEYINYLKLTFHGRDVRVEEVLSESHRSGSLLTTKNMRDVLLSIEGEVFKVLEDSNRKRKPNTLGPKKVLRFF